MDGLLFWGGSVLLCCVVLCSVFFQCSAALFTVIRYLRRLRVNVTLNESTVQGYVHLFRRAASVQLKEEGNELEH